MRVVLFLDALLARDVQVVAARGHYVVAAVGRGVPYRLVFAHQEDGDRGGDAAQ